MKKTIKAEDILQVLKQVSTRIDWEKEQRLISDRIMDSLTLISVVSSLSTAYDIEFDVDELTPENMDSLDKITQTINRLL